MPSRPCPEWHFERALFGTSLIFVLGGLHRRDCTPCLKTAYAPSPGAHVFFAGVYVMCSGVCIDTGVYALVEGSTYPYTHVFECRQCRLVCNLSNKKVIFGACISACEKCKKWQHAVRLLSQMDRQRVDKNLITVSACIWTVLENHCNFCWLFYIHIYVEDCKDILYFAFKNTPGISACAAGGAWEQSLSLLDNLLTSEIRPDLVACNSCISSCVAGEQWQAGLRLLQGLPRLGLDPDVISFSPLFAAFEESRQWQQALALHEQMQHQGNLIVFRSCLASIFATWFDASSASACWDGVSSDCTKVLAWTASDTTL